MDRPLIVNPPELPEPVGFAHAVVAAGGVYLGGQTGEGATLVEQFDSAAAKLVTALRAAGGEPDQLVSLVVYTTDIEGYRASKMVERTIGTKMGSGGSSGADYLRARCSRRSSPTCGRPVKL